MKNKNWIVVCLPLMASVGLLGCPGKTSGGADGAASAAPSTDPGAAAQPTAAAPTPGASSAGKPNVLLLPRLNLDGSAGLLDAATQLFADAGGLTIPTLPDAGGGGGGATGVPPECDQYAAKQELCIQKLAPALQAPARATLGGLKGSWPSLASTPAGRDALLAQCKSLLAQAAACK